MAMRAQELLRQLRRHVGHQLLCARETTGIIEGYIVETVQLKCADCGETILEGTKRIRKRHLAAQ